MRYAENTKVSSDRSRAEIEKTLTRYGATGFAYGWGVNNAMIAFEIEDRHVRFELPLPDKDSEEIALTPTGRERSASQRNAAFEQAVRQGWRALALVIKAKLEAVEAGITTVEEEFLAHIVLPNQQTVGQWVAPKLDAAYADGKMPPLLLPSGRKK